MDAFGSAQGAVDSLLGTLASVIKDEARLLGNVRGDVQFISDEMESMNGFLLHANESCEDEDHQVRAWKKQVRDVAVESERWVQRYQRWAGSAPRGGGLLGYVRRIPHLVLTISERHDIATKIQELKVRAHEVGERRQRYGVEVPPRKAKDPQPGLCGGDQAEEEQYARRCCLADHTEPDITEEDKSKVIRCLTEEGDNIPRLRLIWVAGIGESGKARLASKVFHDDSVASRFDCRSWVTFVPTDRDSLKVAMEQLISVLETQAGVKVDATLSPPDKVSHLLKGKSFLLVFDGIDNPLTWGIMQTVMQNLGAPSGNAIIVITNGMDHLNSSYYMTLNKVANTVIFYLKNAIALVEKTDITEKVEVLQSILIKFAQDYFCTKLLLRVLYVNANRTLEQLQSLSDSLYQGSGWNNARQMVLFCYNDLPIDYRSCLLYLSIYPLGWWINRASLLRRWVAEGLISRRAGLSAPDAAERCLNALLDRGLIWPSENGKIIVVPDPVLSFIVETARAENFAELNLPPELAPYLSIGNGIQLVSVPKERRRRDSCAGMLRSIICSCKNGVPATDSVPPHPVVTFLQSLPDFERQGLLKVLDLELCKGFQKHHLKNICQISELRYLNLRGTDVTQLPEEIHKLQNLETLDIRQTKVTTLPAKIVLLRKLKHLLSKIIIDEPTEGNNGSEPNELLAVSVPQGIGNMTEMQILSHVEVSGYTEELIDELGRLQKLRKLGVVLRGKTEPHLHNVLRAIQKLERCLCTLTIQFYPQDDDDNAHATVLTLPTLLKHIKISGFRDGVPAWALKPNQLVKVTLQDTFLKSDDMRTLGSLPSLCFLALLSIGSCEENIQILGKDEFPNLNFLLLRHTVIANLSFAQGAAPKLQKLVWANSTVNSLAGINLLMRLEYVAFFGSRVSNGVKHAVGVNPKSISVYYE